MIRGDNEKIMRGKKRPSEKMRVEKRIEEKDQKKVGEEQKI